MLVELYKESVSPRVIDPIVEVLASDGVVIYPTDTLYGVGCAINSSKGVERIIRLKGLKPKEALFSFLCESLSQISEFAKVSDSSFRVIRNHLPGPFTMILPGLSKVPPYFISKRKTVGVRIPDHAIPIALVRGLGVPILTTSLPVVSDEQEYNEYPGLMEERWGHLVDVVIDSGPVPPNPSTVVDLTGASPVVLRAGKGEFRME